MADNREDAFQTFLLPDLTFTNRLNAKSPGLDLNHGFLYQIRRNQIRRAGDQCSTTDKSLSATTYQSGTTHEAGTTHKSGEYDKSAIKTPKTLKAPKRSAQIYIPPAFRPPSDKTPAGPLTLENKNKPEASDTDTRVKNVQENPRFPFVFTASRDQKQRPITGTDTPQQTKGPIADTDTPQQKKGPITDTDTKMPDLESSRLGTSGPGTIDMEKVDLENYIEDAQPYIHKAINDPGSIQRCHLQEVGRTIVNRAWEDRAYYSTAAKLCHYIYKKEEEQQSVMSIPHYAFRNGVAEMCTELANQWTTLRDMDIKNWTSFVMFLSSLFGYIKAGGSSQTSISNVLFSCLNNLSTPPCSTNPKEVELLCRILREHGADLEAEDGARTGEVLIRLRDLFLDPTTEPASRRALLPVIEMSGSGWKLPPAAQTYYSQHR